MNPRLVAIAPSMIREINGKKRATSIDLGLGEPTLPPDPEPLRLALEWVGKHGIPYSANPGVEELREQVARFHAYPGLDDPSQVGITVGSQEALAISILALCDPAKHEVLVIEPAYPLYAKLCELFGVPFRTVSLSEDDDFAPSASLVLAAVTDRTRVIVLASPSNPTGRVWPAAELQALADGLRGRDVYIVSDEVYRELYFGERPASPASFWGKTVAVGSLSKSCALTGLRVGWFIAPREAAPQLLKAHQFLVSSTTMYGQRAAIEVFKRPELMSAHRSAYVARRDALVAVLDEAKVRYVPTDGAFYCLVKLPSSDSLRFCLDLLDQEDVVAIPGVAFGAEGWARFSFAGAIDQILEGARRFVRFARR